VTQCGHDVVEVVGSGLEAIQAYTRHQPDVVLMDYWMPRLNGATACRNIWHAIRTRRSSSSPRGATPEITEAGAIAILSKPVSLEPLLRRLVQRGITASGTAERRLRMNGINERARTARLTDRSPNAELIPVVSGRSKSPRSTRR
jgi:CheY-like chemotaxis protein